MRKHINKVILFGLYIMLCVSCSQKENQIKSIVDETVEILQETRGIEEKGNISSLLYIMPQYKEELYSKAYFRQFVKTDMSELRNCYGQLAEKLNNEQMNKQEKTIAMVNYEQIEDFVLKAEKNEINQEKYEKLPNNNYMSYIEKETDYDKKQRISKSNYTIKVDSINTYDMYYSFDCDIYRPYLISKKDIEKLKKVYNEDEEEATTIIELPINKEGVVSSRNTISDTKKIKLYYDGDAGFLYYINGKEIDANLREISIKMYNNDNYAFFEDDEYIIEHKEKDITINILKDANIGHGSSFKQIAMADEEYNFGDDDIKYYYDLTDLFRRIVEDEHTFLTDKDSFVGNYLRFDKKGYVTDFYRFEDVE